MGHPRQQCTLSSYFYNYSTITIQQLLSKTLFNASDIAIAKRLLLKGLPKEQRGVFWFISSGAMNEYLHNKTYYTYLQAHDITREAPYNDEKQIDFDVSRTFSNDDSNSKYKKQKLKRILMTYSKRNASIGYVQGFNFIVSKLMSYIDNEEYIFWILVVIIEHILPINYFSELAGVMADVDLLLIITEQLYHINLQPELGDNAYNYLKNILFQWYSTLFTVGFNNEAVDVIWDMLFLEKGIALFKVGVTLIKMYKDDLTTLTHNNDDMITSIIPFFMKFNKKKELMYNVILKKFRFDMRLINLNRIAIQRIIIKRIESNNVNNRNKCKVMQCLVLGKQSNEIIMDYVDQRECKDSCNSNCDIDCSNLLIEYKGNTYVDKGSYSTCPSSKGSDKSIKSIDVGKNVHVESKDEVHCVSEKKYFNDDSNNEQINDEMNNSRKKKETEYDNFALKAKKKCKLVYIYIYMYI